MKCIMRTILLTASTKAAGGRWWHCAGLHRMSKVVGEATGNEKFDGVACDPEICPNQLDS